MKKRTILIFLTILFVLFAAGTLWGLGYFGGRIFGVPVVSSEKAEKLCNGREDDPDYERIFFDGNPVIRDETENIIYVSKDLSTKGLAGTFTANGGHLYFEKNEAFENPEKAIAEGEMLTLYYVGSDKCFSTKVVVSGLPVMSLTAMYDVGEEIWGGGMKLLDPGRTGNSYISEAAEFAYRGNVSKSYEKKCYKLTLSDEKRSLCGLRKDDDWTLNALYDDIGLVRNATCMRLWNEISAMNSVSGDNCCEAEFVELIVNNEYRGVYLLCERIDQKTTGIGGDDILYKYQVYAPEDSLKKYAKCFTVEYPRWVGESKEDNKTYKQPMLDFMWKTYIPGSGRTTYDDISEEVYLDNAADYLIFCLAVSAYDNRYKNSYFGAVKRADEAYKFFELPWDMNATFGVKNGYKFSMENAEKHDCWSYVGGSLYDLAPEEFGVYVYERYKNLRQSVLSEENMNGIVDEYIKTLTDSGAAERNYKKYPCYRKSKVNLSIDYAELFTKTQIQEYTTTRMAYLDEYMEEEVAKGEAKPNGPDIDNSDDLQKNTTDASEGNK